MISIQKRVSIPSGGHQNMAKDIHKYVTNKNKNKQTKIFNTYNATWINLLNMYKKNKEKQTKEFTTNHVAEIYLLTSSTMTIRND